MQESSSGEISAGLNRRDRQKEETRKKVFEAALEVFRRDGFNTCRIDDIAQLAGVSRGTFYFHFPTKDDVLVELMKVSGDHVAARVEELAPEVCLNEVLHTQSLALTSQWSSDPTLLPDLATVALRQTANQLSDTDANPLRAELARRFGHACKRGELVSFLPPSVLSDLYLANMLAAMLAWCAHPEIPMMNLLEGVTAIFLGGAANRDDNGLAPNTLVSLEGDA